MRTIYGIVVLALFSGACGGRTVTPATSPGAAPADTPGAEAAAQLTMLDYDGLEKNIGERYPKLQKHLEARELDAAAQAAQELAVSLGEIERFWAQNRKPDAIKWAQDARALAAEAAGAASAGDAAKARRVTANMQSACKQCHGAYREMDRVGGYRIKATALAVR